MDELTKLRAELAREQHRREEEQRRREEEQRRREAAEEQLNAEQRRRESMERRSAQQTLTAFVGQCHGLNKFVRAVTKLSAATGGVTTTPKSRFYPQHILPWSTFEVAQAAVWSRYDDSFWNKRAFPPATVMEYIQRQIDPIGSEDELRYIQRSTVENHVKAMYSALHLDRELRDTLPVAGTVSFENQAGFREQESDPPGSAMAGPTLSGDGSRHRRNVAADKFCVSWSEDGRARPLVAIEYKPPHKLTIPDICTGLQTGIDVETDVLSVHEDDYKSLCKRLLAAVITQLFSYMVDKQMRHGYICTGQVFIFLYIADDPTTVYYSMNIPVQDWDADQEHQLQRTAVCQVFAFVHQALAAKPLSQAWSRRAQEQLKRWPEEYIDILAQIPETERKSRDVSAYQPTKWASRSTLRSPIALRSRCNPTDLTPQRHEHEDDDEASPPDSPTPLPARYQTRARAKEQARQSRSHEGRAGRAHGHTRTPHGYVAVQDRPYCTHACILALCQGRQHDDLCPNAADHRAKDVSRTAFVQEVRRQLAIDTGDDAECCPLYIHGARGAMLKIRSAYGGYTLVAKAVTRDSECHLRHELGIYDHLLQLQGSCIPVCCGMTELDLPFFYDGHELTHILLMSWAGVSLLRLAFNIEKFDRISGRCESLSRAALESIRSLGVVHGDAEPRNILYDERIDRVMIVDFDRSYKLQRQALGDVSPNPRRRHCDSGHVARKKVHREHATRKTRIAE